MSKTWNIRPYLRQNKKRKNGMPGSYSLRFLWTFSRKKKPRRIERGLGTNNIDEAEARAYLLLRFICSLGYKVSKRIRLVKKGRKALPLKKALPCAEVYSDLPLFANLPPLKGLDEVFSEQ